MVQIFHLKGFQLGNHIQDERVVEAIELVSSKCDSDGQWSLETRYPGAMLVEIAKG
jgi:hypothetical protein